MEYSLKNVSGIGKATAERLKTAGIDSVQKLASTTLEDLLKLKIKGIGEATAKKYIDSAKELWEEITQKEKEEAIVEQEPVKKEEISKEEKKKKVITSEKTSNIKELMKQQAECNIGLVGHVDHGMIMSFRHFP